MEAGHGGDLHLSAQGAPPCELRSLTRCGKRSVALSRNIFVAHRPRPLASFLLDIRRTHDFAREATRLTARGGDLCALTSKRSKHPRRSSRKKAKT